MLNEGFISTGRVWTVVAWLVVAGLALAAWIVMLVDGPTSWAFMLALTSGVVAPFAATLHVRTYMVRICSLIRINSDDRPVAHVRSLK